MIAPIIQTAMVMCHGSPGSMDPTLSALAVADVPIHPSMAMIPMLLIRSARFPHSVINPPDLS